MRRLALVCAAVALALGLNELVLRAFWTNPFARESADRVLILRAQHGDETFDGQRRVPHGVHGRARAGFFGCVVAHSL